MVVDLHDTDIVEIKVERTRKGYRVWVNGPEGMLLRAYNVKTLQLDIEGHSRTLQHTS